MERLTKRNADGSVAYGHNALASTFCDSLDRLAAYEDTGLMPDEIGELLHDSTGPLHKKLGEWIDADRDGRMLLAPCKPGDTVFYLSGAPSMSNNARFTRVERSRCMGLYFDDKGLQIRLDYDWKGNHGTYGYFGKTVFASLEEAVAAMEGGTNDNM